MCLRERKLLEKELQDAVSFSRGEGKANHIKLKMKSRDTSVVVLSIKIREKKRSMRCITK